MRLLVFIVAFHATEACAYSEIPSPMPSSFNDLAMLLGVAVIALGICRQRNRH